MYMIYPSFLKKTPKKLKFMAIAEVEVPSFNGVIYYYFHTKSVALCAL